MTKIRHKPKTKPPNMDSIIDQRGGWIDPQAKLSWSKSQRRYIHPSRPRHIDPNSPEGQDIAAKYND